MSEVQGPTIFFDAQIKGLDEISKQLKNVVGPQVIGKFGGLADKIESTTDEFDKLRNAVDATVDPLRLFGKRGIELANAIDDIGDPARRSALALSLLKQQTNPGPIEKFNRAVSGMGSELELARVQMGPFGLALGAVAAAAAAAGAAIGAYVAGGLEKLAEASPRAQRANESMTKSLDQLQMSVAQAAIGGEDLAAVMLGVGVTAKTSAGLVDNAAAGWSAFKAENQALGESIQGVANAFIRLTPVVGPAYTALRVFADIGAGLATKLTNAAGAINTLAGAFANAADRARDFFEVVPQSMLGGVGKTLKGWAESGGAAQLRDAEQMIRWTVNKATGGGGKGGGGGSKQDRAKQLQEESAALVGVLANDLDLMMDRARESFSAKFLAPLKAQAEAFVKADQTSGIAAMTANNVAALEKLDVQAMVMDAQFGRLASGGLSIAVEGFMNLAGAIGTAFGEMIVGTQTLEGFGRAMVGVVADMANQFGSLFLLIGTGLAFIPGMGGWSAGLIGAGIGLKALGAGLGAVASGEVGGRGSSRGSGGGGATIDPSRFLRPERSMEPSVTNLKVVILGEEIEKPVTRFMDDVARRGGFRNLATRT